MVYQRRNQRDLLTNQVLRGSPWTEIKVATQPDVQTNHFLRQLPFQLRWRCSKATEETGGLCAVMAGLVLLDM